MSKFIIGLRNSEPAPPEIEYVCGPKSPIATLGACVSEHEVLWSEAEDAAMVFHTIESVAATINQLDAMGCDVTLICVMQRIITYSVVDADAILFAVREAKVNSIIRDMDNDDVEYLKSVGALDLTNVT